MQRAGFTIDFLTSGTYRELRGVAARQLARLPARHSLRPTELVHEAFLRMSPNSPARWKNRGHFFGSAARAIRNALIDHLRARGRIKRDGGRTRVSLSGVKLAELRNAYDIVLLEDTLARLERHDPRSAKTVVLRVVSGMTMPEIARALGVSEATTERDWTYGRAWLYRELRGGRP